MSSTNSTKGLPNPDVYLNHIPPVTAAQFEVSRNIYLATLGAFMWDMLSSLPEDIYLMRHFNSNTIPYFLSRISALSYVLLSVIAKTTPGPDCVKLEFGITSCWVIAISSSSFLFLRRVMAVFADSRSIRFVFSFLWVANVGISVVTPVGSRASPLEDTGYCINGGIKHYVGAATIMPLVFDSLVFLAISYKILTSHGPGDETGWSWRTIFLPKKTLPRLSRAMFRGGQQYYLVTVGVNILITVLITTPSVPPIYQATFTIPDIALTSSMACRVYRNLYFKAKYSGTTFNDTEMNVRFATRLRPSTITTGGMTSTDTPSAVTGDSRKMSSIHVDIEQGTSSNDNVSLPDKVLKPDPVH
ncbi:hypothetical protein Moror_16268 [Moniliophthora roreri MCA 2997]|uniref:Integral membrane protein n=1 Tax=Moniliophthora roreri (strain MCA 2997) TaxID=1381753 RepID=V2XA41_MONRO|nr:hypothetical protein Moror_16268 [Moniliophthora roreri MCA 2997]KAI3597839.1 hypothetical protein WG66_012483 [Moniliophthora roreri]